MCVYRKGEKPFCLLMGQRESLFTVHRRRRNHGEGYDHLAPPQGIIYERLTAVWDLGTPHPASFFGTYIDRVRRDGGCCEGWSSKGYTGVGGKGMTDGRTEDVVKMEIRSRPRGLSFSCSSFFFLSSFFFSCRTQYARNDILIVIPDNINLSI